MMIDVVVSELRDSIFTLPLQKRGIRFLCLSGSSRRPVKNWSLFRRLLRENRYDVIYLNAFQALSLRYALLAKRAGVPVRVLHSHNTGLRPHILRPLKMRIHSFARRLYGGVGTAYFACSPEAASFLFPAKVLRERSVCVLFNGIDTERFRFRPEQRKALRGKLGLEDRFIVGNVGRLCDQKNQLFLLDVLKALLPLRPDGCLLLIGEGEQRAALERRAVELGIRDRVILFGVTDRPEEMLWAMDAFLFPSRFEGLGIAAVEAQCAGLPMLCSEHVPQKALVTGLCRRLPLVDGPEAWAEAAAELSVPESRGEYAAEIRDAGFDVETVSQTLRGALLAAPPEDAVR